MYKGEFPQQLDVHRLNQYHHNDTRYIKNLIQGKKDFLSVLIFISIITIILSHCYDVKLYIKKLILST